MIFVELKATGGRNTGKTLVLEICKEALEAKGFKVRELPKNRHNEGVEVVRLTTDGLFTEQANGNQN